MPKGISSLPAMTERTKTVQLQIDFLAGQVAALGAAIHARLKTHPDPARAAAVLHEALEAMVRATTALATLRRSAERHLCSAPPVPAEDAGRPRPARKAAQIASTSSYSNTSASIVTS